MFPVFSTGTIQEEKEYLSLPKVTENISAAVEIPKGADLRNVGVLAAITAVGWSCAPSAQRGLLNCFVW